MRFFENLLYGIFSGISEFLPISSQAHQALVMQLFGRTQREPLRDILVHIALLIALYTASPNSLNSAERSSLASRPRNSAAALA